MGARILLTTNFLYEKTKINEKRPGLAYLLEKKNATAHHSLKSFSTIVPGTTITGFSISTVRFRWQHRTAPATFRSQLPTTTTRRTTTTATTTTTMLTPAEAEKTPKKRIYVSQMAPALIKAATSGSLDTFFRAQENFEPKILNRSAKIATRDNCSSSGSSEIIKNNAPL